jgi:hypothetical protein
VIHLAALRAATASSTSPLAPRYPELGERWAFTELRANYPDVLVTDYAKLSSVGQAFLVHPLLPRLRQRRDDQIHQWPATGGVERVTRPGGGR